MGAFPNTRSELLRELNLLRLGKRPVGNVKIDWSHELARSTLKCFYLFGPWGSRELVANRQVTLTGAATYTSEGLYTDGNESNRATVPLGFDLSVSGGITIVVAQRHISGVVDWSVLNYGNNEWYGIYHQGSTGFNQTNNNSFDGTLDPSGIRQSENLDIRCVSSQGSNNFKALQTGSALLSDTSTTYPTVANTEMTVGVARKNDISNAASVVMASMMAFSEEIPDSEKRALVDDMYQFIISA